jgi:hypothetical protein
MLGEPDWGVLEEVWESVVHGDAFESRSGGWKVRREPNSDDPEPTPKDVVVIYYDHDFVGQWRLGNLDSARVECEECRGDGSVTVMSGDVETDEDGDPIMETMGTTQMTCRRCRGDGLEYVNGCPQCGEDDLYTSLLPTGSHQQGCRSCGYSTSI